MNTLLSRMSVTPGVALWRALHTRLATQRLGHPEVARNGYITLADHQRVPEFPEEDILAALQLAAALKDQQAIRWPV